MATVYNNSTIPGDFDQTLGAVGVGTVQGATKEDVQAAKQQETTVFNNIISLKEELTENLSFNKMGKIKERVEEAVKKYESVVGNTRDILEDLKQKNPAKNCWVSAWRCVFDPANVKEMKGGISHIDSHGKKLSDLLKLSKAKEARFTELQTQLLNASLTLAAQKNTALAKLTLKQVQQSMNSSLFEKAAITVAGKEISQGNLVEFLQAMNAMLGVEEIETDTRANAALLSCKMDIPDELKETDTLRALRFCSGHAYHTINEVMSARLATGLAAGFVEEVRSLSVNKQDGKTVLTSEVTIPLSSSYGKKPFGSVDATMKVSIGEGKDVEIGYNFYNIQLLKSASLADAALATRSFPEERVGISEVEVV